MKLITTTLKESDFYGVSLDKFQNFLIEKCKDKCGEDHDIEGDILHEYHNELHYVYFTALPNKKGYCLDMHRYYKIVFSMLLFDTCYFSSNVIDKNANYTLQDVKYSFKGYLKHLSNLANN